MTGEAPTTFLKECKQIVNGRSTVPAKSDCLGLPRTSHKDLLIRGDYSREIQLSSIRLRMV